MHLADRKSGYTLVELSISLAVMAILLTGLAGIFFKYDEAKRYRVTKENMKFIEKTLANYVDSNFFIPCPAQGDLLENNSSFGRSVSSIVNSNCMISNSGHASTNYVGMVPVRTLKIPDYYAYDGWGQKFSYSVAKGMSSYTDFLSGNYKGDIKIIDLQGIYKTSLDNSTNKNNYGAAYVLISFGQNGLGAWNKNSTASPILPSSSSREYQNVRYLVDTTTSRKFIQNERNYVFGHIVSYKTLPNLIDIKYQRSPVKIPLNTCSNAEAILNDQNQAYNSISSGYNTAVGLAATATRKLCNNPPLVSKNSASSCLFLPTDLSNIQLWLDGADVNNNSTTPADNATVSTWKDKSAAGTGRDTSIKSGTPTYQNYSTSNPTPFKKGSVYYNGSSSHNAYINFLANSNYTFFIVASGTPYNTRSSTISFIIANNNTSGTNMSFQYGYRYNYNNNNWLHYLGHYNNDIYINAIEQPILSKANASNVVQHLPFISMGIFDKDTPRKVLQVVGNNGLMANAVWTRDNTLLSTSASGMIADCGSFGGNCNPYIGYIAEIIFYNRVLTITEQKQVQGYLLRKWFSGEC